MTRIQFESRFKCLTLFKRRRQTDIALYQFILLAARYECPIGPLARNQFLLLSHHLVQRLWDGSFSGRKLIDLSCLLGWRSSEPKFQGL